MKLSDLARDADSIHKIMHAKLPSSEERDARLEALQPFFLAFRKCITECGPNTSQPQLELDIMCTTLCLVDHYLEAVTAPDFTA